MIKFLIYPFALFSMLFAVSCAGSTKSPSPVADKHEKAVQLPRFDADSAYSFVQAQVNFGPRVPNSNEHRACGDYLENKLKSYGAEVVSQQVELVAYDGTKLQARNIVGQFQPQKNKRVMLCAHWDSRPWADSDPDESKHRTPILGANDGASGVGVLLEIARLLAAAPTEVGIDIIFFDAEDYGTHNADDDPARESMDHSWALGSQYWSRRPHKSDYNARYGILLDLVGAPGSTFYQEGISLAYAGNLVEKIWDVAHKIGHAKYFVKENGGYVTDDHYYVNEFMGLPCVDIINYDKNSENGFGKYHHTIKDDMDWIDRESLRAVGETVVAVIYNEK
ncbi:MAG: M28 family peptidase [Bacteroidaceae bacterium]|nr:M28 family peptidase [Bacteroidaceae bacterium]